MQRLEHLLENGGVVHHMIGRVPACQETQNSWHALQGQKNISHNFSLFEGHPVGACRKGKSDDRTDYFEALYAICKEFRHSVRHMGSRIFSDGAIVSHISDICHGVSLTSRHNFAPSKAATSNRTSQTSALGLLVHIRPAAEPRSRPGAFLLRNVRCVPCVQCMEIPSRWRWKCGDTVTRKGTPLSPRRNSLRLPSCYGRTKPRLTWQRSPEKTSVRLSDG